jgi:hypothetical protein
MTDPLVFSSTTPRHALPMLFPGQAQKEASVNGAHALTDMLLHPAVEGEVDTPPAAPADGECWLVGALPTGSFAGREGCLAGFQHGSWLFALPRDGMRVFDRATGQVLVHTGEWRRVAAPAMPAAGSTIDQEARDAVAGLIAALREVGIFPGQ